MMIWFLKLNLWTKKSRRGRSCVTKPKTFSIWLFEQVAFSCIQIEIKSSPMPLFDNWIDVFSIKQKLRVKLFFRISGAAWFQLLRHLPNCFFGQKVVKAIKEVKNLIVSFDVIMAKVGKKFVIKFASLNISTFLKMFSKRLTCDGTCAIDPECERFANVWQS